MTPSTTARIAFFVLLVATIAAASGKKPAHTYQKGTILGYDTRHDTSPWSMGGAGGNNGGGMTRRAKVYELKGTDLVYQIDYCGSFQEGVFKPGQAVDYRLDGDRLRILHDGTKEYSCKIEGQRAVESPQPDAPPAKP
jgi:hypothetical protein